MHRTPPSRRGSKLGVTGAGSVILVVGRTKMSADAPHWGVAGVGNHGNIAAELDEPIGREGPWDFELRGPRWGFRFEVTGPEAVRSLLAFVREHGTKPGYESYQIAKSDEAEIEMAKTSDLGVRFELKVCGRHFTVCGTIQDEDAVSLRKVLEDVVEDLDT